MSTVQRQSEQTTQDDTLRRRRQRARNWAIFLVLAAFVTIVYVVTIVKLKGAG